MRPSERVARLIIHRPGLLWLGVLVCVLLSVGLIVLRARLHSDVLDMLPKEFESVQIYKLADREFSSSKELMFGLSTPPGLVHPEKYEDYLRPIADSMVEFLGMFDCDLDGFADHFVEMLRQEPWVERLMDQTTMMEPASLAELSKVAVPLILNEPDEDFAQTMTALQPEGLRARFAELKGKLSGGIGRTVVDAQMDPLGIVIPSLKGLQGMVKGKKGEDPTFRVLYVHCQQDDLNEPACKAVMAKVEDFKKRAVASWPSEQGVAPVIYCTGRTAYVAEMASKLKSDIIWTISLSLFLVAVTFYAGFRKWNPLLAIMSALVLTCVLAVASGAALFGSLNMITIGLCSLLVGLGVDFSMVLYSLYTHERARGATMEQAIATSLQVNGRSIWFGAMTTAAAFLCLLASGSPGYGELGVLIACGILMAAGVMMTFLWLFLTFGVRDKDAGASCPAPAFGASVDPHGPSLTVSALLGRIVFVAVISGLIFLGLLFAARHFGWSDYVRDNLIAGDIAAAAAYLAVIIFSSLVAPLPTLVSRRPNLLLQPSLVLLVAVTIFAVLPVGKLTFDIDPKSLEPHPSDAGDSMREIMARLNSSGMDSLWAIIEAPDAESFSEVWQKAEASWQKLTVDGAPAGTTPLFTSVATPAGLATSPTRMKANAAKLAKGLDFQASKAALDAALAENGFNAAEFAGPKRLVEALGEAAQGRMDAVSWRANLPSTSAWWFVIEGFLSSQRPLGRAFLSPVKPIETPEEAKAVRAALAVPGVNIGISGWSFTLIDLKPWSQHKMVILTVLMIGINAAILSYLLRDWKQVTLVLVGLVFSVAGMIATIKLMGLVLNLFNVLAFPLVLGVGVDYYIYTALAVRAKDPINALQALMKPLLLSGFTTVIGFGSLALSYNPALRGLGILCAIGVGWCILTTFVFVLPGCALLVFKKRPQEVPETVEV